MHTFQRCCENWTKLNFTKREIELELKIKCILWKWILFRLELSLELSTEMNCRCYCCCKQTIACWKSIPHSPYYPGYDKLTNKEVSAVNCRYKTFLLGNRSKPSTIKKLSRQYIMTQFSTWLYIKCRRCVLFFTTTPFHFAKRANTLLKKKSIKSQIQLKAVSPYCSVARCGCWFWNWIDSRKSKLRKRYRTNHWKWNEMTWISTFPLCSNMTRAKPYVKALDCYFWR